MPSPSDNDKPTSVESPFSIGLQTRSDESFNFSAAGNQGHTLAGIFPIDVPVEMLEPIVA